MIWVYIGMNEEVVIWVENIMFKMISDKMIKNFEDFDIDLMVEFDKVMKWGEDKFYVFFWFLM